MATTEHEGLQIYKDASGNLHILYPITKADLVDGLSDFVAKYISDEFGGVAILDDTGAVPVPQGGTGKTALTSGSYLVGNGTGAVQLKTPAQVLEHIGVPGAIESAITEGIEAGTIGNARIEKGTYVGTSTSSSKVAGSLTFGFVPKIVFLARSPNTTTNQNFNIAILIPGSSLSGAPHTSGGSNLYTSLEGTTIQWWNNNLNTPYALNESGVTHYYVAFG